MEVNCSNAPQGVIKDQRIAHVNNWMTPKAKEISELTGTKSFARNREELELLEEQPELADTSQGKTAWKGDALNQILGEDKNGRVHGLGLVPNPNKVFDL